MKRTTRTATRSLIAMIAALALLAAACGDDDTSTSADDETTTSEATEGETTTTAEATTTAAAEDDEATEDGADEAADGIAIELTEWSISEPTGVAVGANTFALMNVGENPHAFAIAKGASYDDLPQKANGAVDTEALGDDFLGSTTENIAPGESGTIDFDLEAGDYVFFCPIEFGPNSHAGAGQVLSVTVG